MKLDDQIHIFNLGVEAAVNYSLVPGIGHEMETLQLKKLFTWIRNIPWMNQKIFQ